MLKMMKPAGSSLLVSLMFKAAREFPKECRKTREEIDIRLRHELKQW